MLPNMAHKNNNKRKIKEEKNILDKFEYLKLKLK